MSLMWKIISWAGFGWLILGVANIPIALNKPVPPSEMELSFLIILTFLLYVFPGLVIFGLFHKLSRR